MAFDGSIKIDTSIDQSKLAGQLATLKGTLTTGATQIATAIAAATVATTAAITGLAVESVKTFSEFETGMNEVFTLLPGISGQAMLEMEGQVKRFAEEFSVLPEEVVPALYQSLSAGVPQDNVFSFLETANQLAVGGVTDLETAVDGLSSVVNAYGSDIITAAEASDAMFTAVKLGKTTVDELASSLFNVIPTAAGIGVEFNDITAAMASLTAQGTPTSVATTQMRQLLVELSSATSDVAERFEELTDQSFNEFINSGGNVADALKILSDDATESGLSVKDFFGSVEAANAALALTGNLEGYRSNIEAMGDAAGATEAAYEQMAQGISFSLDGLKATFEVLKINIGDTFGNTAVSAIEEFSLFLDDNMNNIGTMFEGLSGLIGGSFSEENLSMFTDSLTNLLTNGAKAVIKGISTFVKIFAEVFKAVVTTIGNSAPDVADAILEIIPVIVDTLAGSIDTVIEAGILIVGAIIQGLTDSADQIVEGAFAIIIGLANAIVELTPMILTIGMTLIMAIADGIMENLPLLMDSAYELLSQFTTFLTENIDELMIAAIQMINMLATFIAENTDQLVAASLEIIMVILNALLNNLPLLLEAGINLIMAIATGILENIPVLIETVVSLIPLILEALIIAIPLLLQAGSDLVDAMANGILNNLVALATAIHTILTDAINTATAFWGDFFNTAVEIGANIVSGVWEGVKNLANDVWNWLTDVVNVISNFVSDVWNEAKDLGTNLVDGIMEGIGDLAGAVWDVISGAFGNAVQWAKDLLGIHSPSTVFKDIGMNIVKGTEVGVEDEEQSLIMTVDNSLLDPFMKAKSKLSGLVMESGMSAASMMSGNGGNSVAMAGTPLVIELDGETIAETVINYTDQSVQLRYGEGGI